MDTTNRMVGNVTCPGAMSLEKASTQQLNPTAAAGASFVYKSCTKYT